MTFNPFHVSLEAEVDDLLVLYLTSMEFKVFCFCYWKNTSILYEIPDIFISLTLLHNIYVES
jgi:hypothetical protein